MGTIRSKADVSGVKPALSAADMLAGVSDVVEDAFDASEASDNPDRAVLASGRRSGVVEEDPSALIGRT